MQKQFTKKKVYKITSPARAFDQVKHILPNSNSPANTLDPRGIDGRHDWTSDARVARGLSMTVLGHRRVRAAAEGRGHMDHAEKRRHKRTVHLLVWTDVVRKFTIALGCRRVLPTARGLQAGSISML